MIKINDRRTDSKILIHWLSEVKLYSKYYVKYLTNKRTVETVTSLFLVFISGLKIRYITIF